MSSARRFLPPWAIDDGCFIVRDANGQTLGYLISRVKPGRTHRDEGGVSRWGWIQVHDAKCGFVLLRALMNSLKFASLA